MAELDRSEVVSLLERLGAESDQEVLAAARSLHAHMVEAGTTWDDVLRPAALETAEDDDPAEEVNEPVRPILGDKADDAKIIDQLLARKGLSKEMRQSLADLKRGLGDGSTDATDRRYIRALARRLGA
jgi:hypothetical protein